MVTEETERKFLTLGWWLLNVGWKDVAERVRSAVEVVFSGYVLFMTSVITCESIFCAPTSRTSLKIQLEFSDVEQPISDVRKRVEYQNTTSHKTVKYEDFSWLIKC